MPKRCSTRSLPKTLIYVARTRISPAARGDLREIRTYSKAAFGVEQTSRYLEGLREAFRLLRERPFAGGLDARLGEGVRGFHYCSHRIYYLPMPNEVLIIRILHHARDVAPALSTNQ